MGETIWVAIIGGIIGPIIVLTSKWYLDNKLGKKKTDMVTEALEVGELVTTKLFVNRWNLQSKYKRRKDRKRFSSR